MKTINIAPSFYSLAVPYVLGELSVARRKRIETSVKKNGAAYAKELAALESGVNLLPAVLPLRTPSPAAKERLMNRARALRPVGRPFVGAATERTVERSTRIAVWVTAAFGLVLVGGLMVQIDRLQKEITRQSEELSIAEKKADQVRSEFIARDSALSQRALNILLAPNAASAKLAGLPVSPKSTGKITWAPGHGFAVLHVSNLPATSAKDYELWIIKGKQKIPAGVFSVGTQEEQRSLVKILPMDESEISHVDAFAITLEPKGGVAAPTGDIYLLGKPSTSPR